MLGGTTVVDAIGYRSFWKLFHKDKEKAMPVMQLLALFSRLLGIGSALLIVTGIAMMAITHGVFGEQLWFRIKFVLVLLIVANGLLVGRSQGVKLRKLIATGADDISAPIASIKSGLNRFHIIQLVLLFTIVLLSVFRFN